MVDINAIFQRRSIRQFTDQAVSDELVEKLLRAGMAAPSAGNQQPWEFIVMRDQNNMNKILEVHPYAKVLQQTSVAIMVAGDTTREKFPGFWVQDCSAATENILVEATDLGLGAVWLGIYPLEERVKKIKEFFDMPDYVQPLSIIAVGYPAEAKEPADRFDPKRVHMEKW